jgi:hypothetical protein
MSNINNGGPAFPFDGYYGETYGMTLRDWFAGQALAGLIADPSRDGSADDRARYAYAYADAMLRAREVKP